MLKRVSGSLLGSVALLAALYAWRAAQGTAGEATGSQDGDHDGIPLGEDRDADADGIDALLDPDADGDGIPNSAEIVHSARAITGELSDPLMGKYGNLLGRIGMRVCTDVVLDAWLAAGIPLARILRDRAAEVPEAFAITPDNRPEDPYFPRRVRNLRALFSHADGLVFDRVPRAGDLAFFGDTHVAVVTDPDTFSVVEARSFQVAERSGGQVQLELGQIAVCAGPS